MKTDNQPKHTQGEWKVKQDGGALKRRIVCNNIDVADCYSSASGLSQEEAEANARLIVKAVNMHDELVRHLKRCIEALELIGGETGQSMPLTVADAKSLLKQAEQR